MGEDGPHHLPQSVPDAVTQGTAQHSGSAIFLSDNGIYAPLQGLDPNDVLQGGYGFCSPTDGGATPHPGVDLNAGNGGNADCGLGVCAPVQCVVAAVLPWDGFTSGEGNHLWLQTVDDRAVAEAWIHCDHLDSIWVRQGELVDAGQQIGSCGRTGNWDWCHLHLELSKWRPGSWWQWPYGWSEAAVREAYHSPREWFAGTVAKAGTMGGGDIPQEAVAVLEDWQIKGWILSDLYTWAGIPFNPDSGTAQAWVDFLRKGTYLGRPRTEERPYGEGEDAGVWVEYDQGVLLYRLSDGQASITG